MLSGKKRNKILEAALHTFGESGYKGTIQDIADKADIAAGSIYTYFGDKEALFRAAADAVWDEFLGGMNKLSDSPLPVERKILWLMDFGFDLLARIHPLLRGMYSDVNRRDLFHHNLDRICVYMEEIFSDQLKFGVFDANIDLGSRRFLLRLIVSGVLFNLSQASPDNLNSEVNKIKKELKRMLLQSGPIDQTVATRNAQEKSIMDHQHTIET